MTDATADDPRDRPSAEPEPTPLQPAATRNRTSRFTSEDVVVILSCIIMTVFMALGLWKLVAVFL